MPFQVVDTDSVEDKNPGDESPDDMERPYQTAEYVQGCSELDQGIGIIPSNVFELLLAQVTEAINSKVEELAESIEDVASGKTGHVTEITYESAQDYCQANKKDNIRNWARLSRLQCDSSDVNIVRTEERVSYQTFTVKVNTNTT